MKQLEALNDFPLLHSVSNKREQLELASIDIELLRAQAGSQDPQLASISQRLLRTKWDLDPMQDALQAESKDINEQLKPFSKDELKVIFKNLVGVQLTEGCNGNCPFCMFGTKSGVTAKYSFDSLRTLFQQNSDMMIGHPFTLYWDSDPYDYRDGVYSFVDVYKLYRQMLPNNAHYISTAMPRGGESDFIKFMSYIASEQVANGASERIVPVRISVTQQNIQRVEATLLKLTNTLLADGYTQKYINKLYGNVITAVDRFDNFLLPIGPYIKKADDLKDTFSTACRDGVIIRPTSCQVVMITAATVYEPSGQITAELIPGQAEKQVPTKIRDENYAIRTFDETNLSRRIQQTQTMLPIIKHVNDEVYSLPDKVPDMVLKLGREVASLTRIISNFSKMARLKLDATDALEEKYVFLNLSTRIFREREKYTQILLSSADQLYENRRLSEDDRKELQYYILLARTHLAKMDFIASQVEEGLSINKISTVASILAQVGRKQIDKLSEIIDALPGLDEDTHIVFHPMDKATINRVISTLLKANNVEDI